MVAMDYGSNVLEQIHIDRGPKSNDPIQVEACHTLQQQQLYSTPAGTGFMSRLGAWFYIFQLAESAYAEVNKH